MTEQRLLFGQVAELYDRARAAYPEPAITQVLAYAGEPPPRRALEIGAGTAKATVSFARHGLTIVAVEPDEDMARVAARNCAPFPDVHIEITSFEQWDGGTEPFDLVFSAQAWHWLAPDVRCAKAADLMRLGGTLALLWHRTSWRGGQLFDEFAEVYERVAPALRRRDASFPGLGARMGGDDIGGEIVASGRFEPPSSYTYPWNVALTGEGFTDLLLTQSDHRMLDERTRSELLDGVREVVDRHGGEIQIPHTTLLVLTRRSR